MSDELDDCFTTSLVVTRFDPSVDANEDGFIDDPTSNDFNILASVQPLSGDEMQMLTEGQRTRRTEKLFTITELKTVDNVAGTKADRVSVYDKNFEVQNVERWVGLDLDHFECVLVEVNES